MDGVLKTLCTEHNSGKICLACKIAIREMKKLKSTQHQNASSLNIKDFENCFFQVFLSNFNNFEVLSLVVEALVLLMSICKDVKTTLVKYGVFFNIDDLLHQECDEKDKKKYLKYGYTLSIALTEDASKTLKHFMDSNIVASIKSSLVKYNHEKEILALCLQQISILISLDNATDDLEILELKQDWCDEFFTSKVDDAVRMSEFTLTMMNRFLSEAQSLQLYGLKCLMAFATTGGGVKEIHERGGLDTACHAVSLYSENPLIILESFTLIANIFKVISYEDVAFKVDYLCEIIVLAIQKSIKNMEQLIGICESLKILLLIGSNLGQHLLEKKVPLVLFQTLNYISKEPTSSEFKEEAHLILDQCLFLIMSNANDDIRNGILASACESSEVELALFSLFLGANVNFGPKNAAKPLALACKNEDETMVKQLLIMICAFQHIGLWMCRFEEIQTSVSLSIEKHDDQITAALLWYLLNRDQNGVAEWNKCNLSHLKSEWMETVFSSQNSKSNLEGSKNICLEAIQQSSSYQLGLSVLQSFSAGQSVSDGTDSLKPENFVERKLKNFEFVFEEKKCPLQHIHSSVENVSKSTFFSRAESNDSVVDEEDDDKLQLVEHYRCPRCRGYVAFREFLQLSFDEDTLQEESLHQNPIEVCNCPVVFPPSHISSVDIKELQLAHNGISSLESFSLLSNSIKQRLCATVKQINLLGNNLAEIPASVARIFKHLVDLNLSKNELICFPFEVVKSCPLLEVLNLSANKLQEGTSFLSDTSRRIMNATGSKDFQHGLQKLNVSHNAYHEFPTWMFEVFPNLVVLEIRKNAIASFLSKDSLDEMAQHSKVMAKLEQLDLSENRLYEFSIYLLRYAQSLKRLDLSKNNLSDVTMCNETFLSGKLTFVDLSYNQIKEIPRFIYCLPRLKTLLLSNNSLSEITVNVDTPPWKCRSLQHFDLSNNEMTDISTLTSILVHNWPSTLKNLDLSHNAIVQLPPGLGKLRSLEVLNVSDNLIQVLPDELGLLSNLMSFSIRDNELSLEQTILKGSAREIRQFLHGRLKKSVKQNRVKLILVGDPNAGKTTLLKTLKKAKRGRSLSGSAFDVFSGNASKLPSSLATIGVNVVEISLSQGNRSFQLSVWDFAGQEDFYATHPCFISERAMYIAMYDASKGVDQLRTLKPWLTAIHARATHCPVLILGSHADQMTKNKDARLSLLESELQAMSRQEWFPRGAVRSAKPDVYDVRENFPALKTTILTAIIQANVQGHPLVGDMVPDSYVQLSELLEKEANKRTNYPVISFNELVNLLQQEDNPLSSEFESSSELMLAVKYLHRTGFLLHFDDPRSRLQNLFFIKPAWLCMLLAQVVTVKEDSSYKIPYIDKNGILSKSSFSQNFASSQLNNNNPFPPSFLPQLFRLLENFEVMLWHGGDQYLVPSKLPVDKPNLSMPQSYNRLIRHISNQNNTPSRIKTWREGVYFEWKSTGDTPAPFVLVQSGSVEFDLALKTSSDNSSKSNASDYFGSTGNFKCVDWENGQKDKGIEIVVPRSHEGVILLSRLVDHVTSLVDEWYPGLMRPDMRGKSLFQQYSPCSVCQDMYDPVACFCIDDLAESALCIKEPSPSLQPASYKVISKSGVLLLYCDNHLDTPVPLTFIAPEINLDDFDPSLRLDPSLLSFEPSQRNRLGEGGFGVVYQAVYDDEDVAIKTFTAASPDMSYKMLRNELNVLAQHQHPSIISLKGFIPPAFSTPNIPLPLLAMEFARLGCLGKLLSDMTKLSVETRKLALSPFIKHRIAYEVAEGLCFLHTQNIVYRDLKPDNILLSSLDPTSPTIAKITDYGISTFASPSGIPGAIGTPGYSAPEVANLKIAGRKRFDLFPYSIKCDIYSYGLVLHELAVGRSPWVDYVFEEHYSEKASMDILNQSDEIVSMGILPSPITTYKGASAWPYAQELVTKCLNRNPEERPTSCEIVSLLKDIQSFCYRSIVPILSSDPVFSRTYRDVTPDAKTTLRCRSYKDDDVISSSANRNPPTVDIYYSANHDVTESRAFSVMKVSVDAEKGSIVPDDSWLPMNQDISISCITKIPYLASNQTLAERQQLPMRSFSTKQNPETSPLLVAGTDKGHLIVIQNRHYKGEKQFACSVTSIHFHRFQEKKSASSVADGGGYVVIGLEDCSLAIYTLDQINNTFKKQPLHVLKLDVMSAQPVQMMDSIGSHLYAVCGDQIVLLSLADSGSPIVQSVFGRSAPVQCFAAGLAYFYDSTIASDKVTVSQNGDFRPKTSLCVADVLIKRSEVLNSLSVSVSSIFVDNVYSALWVGTDAGHVIVYSESRYDVLAVLHRHTGPIQRIFVLSDTSAESEVVVCLGKGFRPVSEDFNRSEDSVSRTPRFNNSSIYLSLWDADLPKQAPVFTSILKERKNLLGSM